MSKWIVDIHGDIEGDYELIKKYEEPCEDEYIKVPKNALKYRTAGIVAYNSEWLKNHFDIERAVICGEQYSCDDVQKIGHCKDCKHFEYNSVAKVDGIPLIVAHEICKRWGEGCKTSEDGYCFLFEPKEDEDNTDG